jgi:hypothetical protein
MVVVVGGTTVKTDPQQHKKNTVGFIILLE